ncbi:hypothetical protein BH23PAT2_BH23PAT2_00660 [soil metagenome]
MSSETNQPNQEVPPVYESKTALNLEVTCLAPEGLGFGEGSISYRQRAAAEVPTSELNNIVRRLQSNDILVPIDIDEETNNQLDDDGCGDGRGVTDSEGNVVEVVLGHGKRVFKRSLHRAKVFGGGATMATASEIGLGHMKDENVDSATSLQGAFKRGIASMKNKAIGFGAHSDEHAGHGNCGCGAIDKAPQIVANTVTYRDEIRATILSLDESINPADLDIVLDNYKDYAEFVAGQDYKGEEVLDDIKTEDKVVKKLVRGHNEMYIVLNGVKGRTVNQYVVRDASEESVQVFAVDVWRAQDIANRLYVDEDESVRTKAFLSELVYTLATAGTLTDGSLPVYSVSKS